MCCEEHMVGLDGGADEEAGECHDRKTQALDQILVLESLNMSVYRIKNERQQ